MHRVDPKKHRAAALRIAAYALTLALTAITTVVLLYVALGYRFDSRSGHVVRSGLLLVDNKPEAARIYINNELKDNASPGRFVLPAGNYALKLSLDGYREWSKQVPVAASGVREVNYPLLLPQQLKPEPIGTIDRPYLASQSKDRKLLLLHSANQAELALVTLNPESLERTPLPLPTAVRRENGNPGNFSVVEWALDNKHVLLQQTLPSGTIQLLSLDVTKPAELVNISSLYGAGTPGDIHYRGSDTKAIYGLKDGILGRYSLEKNEAETLLQNVRSYQPYGNDTVLFDRTSSGGAAEVGIWDDSVTTVVHSPVASQVPSLLKYASFDGHAYFAVAAPDGTAVTIYRDPLENPLPAKQTPFITVNFDKPQRLDFSDSSQFLLIQNGSTFAAYDFDNLRRYNVTVPFGLAADSRFTWLDAAHLQVRRNDGMAVMMDYDGTNQQELIAPLVGTELYFANNYRHLYRVSETDSAVQLQAVPLTVER